MTTIAKGNANLLKLAEILEKADALHKERNEPGYDQTQIAHACGSPACSIGHWLDFKGKLTHEHGHNCAAWEIACEDFAIKSDSEEDEELFGATGCNRAKTAAQAAAYIRHFVARRT